MQLKYPAGILFVLMNCLASAQIDTAKSKTGAYYFDGDEVVFEFDLRAYEKAVRTADIAVFDFADLGILEVAVSGNFNDLSDEGWVMQRFNKHLYLLRKHLKEYANNRQAAAKYLHVDPGPPAGLPPDHAAFDQLLGQWHDQEAACAQLAEDLRMQGWTGEKISNERRQILTASFQRKSRGNSM